MIELGQLLTRNDCWLELVKVRKEAMVESVKKKPSKRSIKERIKQLDAEIDALDEKILYHYSVGSFNLRDRQKLNNVRTVLRLQLEGYSA